MSMIFRFVLIAVLAGRRLGLPLLDRPGCRARSKRKDVSGTDNRAVRDSALRRPIALAQSKDGHWLFVANQRSGSISVIDLANMRVEAEMVVCRKLADLAITSDGANVVVVDEEAGELVVLTLQGSKLAPKHRLKVGATPVSVQLSRDGSRCTVASLWPCQLTIIALGKSHALSPLLICRLRHAISYWSTITSWW